MLQIFFICVTAIAVVLCFFVLWLSFLSNIYENAWQHGVLRALGLTAFQVLRVYIYEALCLVCSGLLLGTIVGMLLGITLQLQFNMFIEAAFSFQFPYLFFFLVSGLSVLVAIGASWLASIDLAKKPIANALKGL